ncbi:MAG: ATP-binding protein, partial [Desulfobulbaceae bacterium]|nr:ATP-binding protein [Desulfobulbaceae bacterium]
AAMNPCPCGYLGDPKHDCTCTALQIQKYESRLSGPLLDRIDLHLDVPAVPFKDISNKGAGESSAMIKKRVVNAREIQKERFKRRRKSHCNSHMRPQDIKKYCALDEKSSNLLEKAMDRLGLSARAYHRILKISRTIADLEGSEAIRSEHVAEAVQYRRLDRKKQ